MDEPVLISFEELITLLNELEPGELFTLYLEVDDG